MAKFMTVWVFNISARQTLGINLTALLTTSCNILFPDPALICVKIK
jgi:hypothetical protein